MPVNISDQDYAAALARGRAALERPHVISARYLTHADEIELHYSTGWIFRFRPHETNVFSKVPKESFKHMHVTPGGAGLILDDTVDSPRVSVSIPGLVADLIPFDIAMSAVSSAHGRVRSAAKTAAARENGQKGGRPPKNIL